MSHLDPCTNKCELEVQRIIHLQNLAHQLLDAFINTRKMTKSYISATGILNRGTMISPVIETMCPLG